MAGFSGTFGIIGVGGLAEFVVEGLRHAGGDLPILLSPRGAKRAADLSKRFDCRIAPDNQAVVDQSDLVMVATAPPDVIGCVSALKWRAGQPLLCVAINVPLASLSHAAPAARVLRAMPSASAAIGLCPTPLYPPNAEAKGLLERLGPVFEVEDEAGFDAATALAGYHLWVFGLIDVVAKATASGGLSEGMAADMVAAHTRAAAEFVLRRSAGAPVRGPLDEHGVPGTMTAQGMGVLEEAGGLEGWRQGYERALARLKTGC
ncbi:MAG: NAD(P)-binding domain-containing protein [Parvibaculaceae bacterium]